MRTLKILINNFPILLLICIISCTSKTTQQLTGRNKKSWDVVYLNGVRYKRPVYNYIFHKNGECLYYNYIYENSSVKKKLFDYDDVEISNTWSLINDSLVRIQDYDYILKSISAQKLVLVDLKRTNDSIVLVANNL